MFYYLLSSNVKMCKVNNLFIIYKRKYNKNKDYSSCKEGWGFSRLMQTNKARLNHFLIIFSRLKH